MTNNPLIAKWEELNKKKEPPKLPKIEDYAGEKTIADELKKSNFIKAENAKVAIKTYDRDDLKISFQQVAEQLQTSRAQVLSMSMEMGYPIGECYTSKTLTFEVRVYD
jgi:hypothetical protein